MDYLFSKLFYLFSGENGQGIGTSSFADWVQNVSKLNLPTDEKIAADELIDTCYSQLEEGIIHLSCRIRICVIISILIMFIVTGLQFLNNEGSALYSIESKANHSCIPNAQATFPHSNHCLHLVATCDIQCGNFNKYNINIVLLINKFHNNFQARRFASRI